MKCKICGRAIEWWEQLGTTLERKGSHLVPSQKPHPACTGKPKQGGAA